MEPAEIDGRIMMLQQQRDEAMNRCVVMAGQLHLLQKKLEEKEKADGSPGRSHIED